MDEKKSILHELYVFSEWKPEPEYIQKPDSILPENISALWRWVNFLGPKKNLLDAVTAHLEKQQKWHIALGDEGKVIAVLTDNILEIRTKRSEYATIAARTTVSRDAYPQWRKLVWSPDCSLVVLAYGNGVVSFFDLTASNLFNIPTDCSRPGGLECTDNTHAVADIIFMPLRVKDTKWNWEVLVVTYDGRLRGFLVSQTDACKLHHSFRFPAGVAALRYCESHSTMYVAGVPRGPAKEARCALGAGLSAWRILNDEPYYKLSVVSDHADALANDRFKLYVPFGYSNNLAFIVRMELSPDGTRLVCLHCNGDVSVWRLPLLKLECRWALATQPHHDLRNPLAGDEKPGNKKDLTAFYPADINWWSNEEIIVSRFSGAVTICDIETMANILGKKPEFFQGAPQITRAHGGTAMVLECEGHVLPARTARSDPAMEVVKIETDSEDTMLELAKELIKSVLYAITDIETFQPKPRRITVVSRVYRLLGLKSTTPTELFSRKIESGAYGEALALADRFQLDSDLVYQQQWRKNPVSSDAIHNYLSKVSKKIWAVHQCVDRLPESLPAAKELLQFGLQLTNDTILAEINAGRAGRAAALGAADVLPRHLNAYTAELLRCRHVMLFYQERLQLYESILKCEKSTYEKDEYDRLRSNSIAQSALRLARSGRVAALACLWPHVRGVSCQLRALDALPEPTPPALYRRLLPRAPAACAPPEPPAPPAQPAHDWCRNEIFRSIWSSNWSEDSSPDSETAVASAGDVAAWYERRARAIERRSGLVSHALALLRPAAAAGLPGLERVLFHLTTLDVLVYDVNVEGVSLDQLQNMSTLEVCSVLMKMSTPQTFVSDLKQFVVPYLKRCESLSKCNDSCVTGLIAYLESISVEDLSPILLVLQSPAEFELDVRTHLELVERCLFAHTGTDQLDKACDLLHTLLKESDGSISSSSLVRRVRCVERLVAGSERLSVRGVLVPPRELVRLRDEPQRAAQLLTKLARSLALREEKPTPQDWDKLLKDLLELQSTLFCRVAKDKCYEIYALALLTSGDAGSIKLARSVLTCSPLERAAQVPHPASVALVSAAATEYFNSANSLVDPALELAKCCLQLINAENAEIQKELDLINALPILHSFNVGVLPVQVRICEDRMSLIEACLMLDPNAYLASHKLLKLATLLRIADDDEQAREGQVLQLAAARAMAGGGAGGAAAVELARRLAALRFAPAAGLLSAVGRAAQAHADAGTRRQLLAAALAHCPAADIEANLRDRMALELESLQQMGVTLREHSSLSERWPSTDDEFADAVTTPMVEKKDLVPAQSDVKIPLFNYLLDTFQNKFAISDNKPAASSGAEPSAAQCQEFYQSLYPELGVSPCYYRYDRFSLPDATDGPLAVGQNVLKWFYIQNCLEEGVTCELETEVVQRCAEELVYRDTALGVACLLRAAGGAGGGAGGAGARRLQQGAGAAAALYAELVHCNCNILRDNAYFTKPAEMARGALGGAGVPAEQLALVRQCLARLAAVADVDALRALGYSVNGLLFNADADYRREVIYRLARSPEWAHVSLACRLARARGLCELDVWLQHAAGALQTAPPAPPAPPPPPLAGIPGAHARIKEALWPLIPGTEHNALIMFFSLLKSVDEKALVGPLTAAEHIKLLKKAKAASPELDYKLLVSGEAALAEHVVGVLRPDNVALLSKLLRTLPPALAAPLSLPAIYAKWLTRHFFSVPSNAPSKKWMQQYRQCASYFNKLAKHELVQFVEDTCFSDEAIQRVPAGTRNLMIMQAVDYCQQEQENDFKFNKKGPACSEQSWAAGQEQSWAGVGQELARWARFLDILHSDTVQHLLRSAALPALHVWPEVEKSHGDPERLVECLARGLLQAELRAGVLARLLQVLHVPARPDQLLQHAARHCRSASDVEILVSRMTAYSKEGVKLPEELLETVMQKASEFALPPHKQIGLLSLSQKTRVHDSDDMLKIAQYTMELLRTEWPDSDYTEKLTDEMLLSEEGRRDAFSKYLSLADSWQRKKALVDILQCWPPTRNSDSRSLHCEYVHHLLADKSDQTENLMLIKLLLQRPVLAEEEVNWLADNVAPESVINAIWVLLLSKSEHFKDNILNLALQHKIFLQNHEVDEDLLKELLDNGMFIKLVSCPLYSSFINYIMSKQAAGGEAAAYSAQWAAGELARAGLAAEAGQLRLAAAGLPAALRGFSQAVAAGMAESARAFGYCKDVLDD